MSNFKDLSGKTFGNLLVIQRLENKYTSGGNIRVRYLCKCNCKEDSYIEVDASNLNNGSTLSCGCLSKNICKKKYNIYDLTGEYTFKGEEFYFDLEDYDKIKDYCWRYDKRRYIVTHSKNKNNLTMHQLIIGYNNADHINRKPYDNRKNNLRPSNQSENISNGSLRKNNKTGIIGVMWHKKRNKYLVKIGKNYKTINIGYFNDMEDAIKARLKAEKEYFGEFSPQSTYLKNMKLYKGDYIEIYFRTNKTN